MPTLLSLSTPLLARTGTGGLVARAGSGGPQWINATQKPGRLSARGKTARGHPQALRPLFQAGHFGARIRRAQHPLRDPSDVPPRGGVWRRQGAPCWLARATRRSPLAPDAQGVPRRPGPRYQRKLIAKETRPVRRRMGHPGAAKLEHKSPLYAVCKAAYLAGCGSPESRRHAPQQAAFPKRDPPLDGRARPEF
jgi:hypothetical protein